jgi:hypothetical protein
MNADGVDTPWDQILTSEENTLMNRRDDDGIFN